MTQDKALHVFSEVCIVHKWQIGCSCCLKCTHSGKQKKYFAGNSNATLVPIDWTVTEVTLCAIFKLQNAQQHAISSNSVLLCKAAFISKRFMPSSHSLKHVYMSAIIKDT